MPDPFLTPWMIATRSQMNKTNTFFADTTVVYYRLHSHTLLQEAVKQAVANGDVVLNNFVRGEYIRGYVAGLIELFTVIQAEKSVSDGFHVFNAESSKRPRKLANALQSTTVRFKGFEGSEDIKKTLRRLGEYIRTTLMKFDAAFPTRVRDPLGCDIGVMSFPQETYSEDQILDFYKELETTRDDPACDQCSFRKNQIDNLTAANIDLYSPAQQKMHASHKGYVSQAESIDKAVRSPKSEPTCWYCDRLGDTIIALSAPKDTIILTGDGQSFPVLAEILRKSLHLLPSLQTLREQRDAPG